jgi:hypothetical protein
MTEIHVTPWGTREALPNDLSAPVHDCLWQIAQEQAVLKRMKDTGEDWATASRKVSSQDVTNQLNVVCDDNGFRRVDGTGQGRDPHLIDDKESIKVRIDPNDLNKTAAGVTAGQPSQGAYNKTVASDNGQGVNLNKKDQVDAWVAGIPGFPLLPEASKAALLGAYGRDGIDPQKLATLGGSQAFAKLEPAQQVLLLGQYGAAGKSVVTQEVDKIVAASAGDQSNNRLAMIATPAFLDMTEKAQKLMLDRY